jgi:hypothetical protein
VNVNGLFYNPLTLWPVNPAVVTEQIVQLVDELLSISLLHLVRTPRPERQCSIVVFVCMDDLLIVT